MNIDMYHIELVNSTNLGDWELLREMSPQSTPFEREDYLKSLEYTCDRYILYYKNKIYMGLCIPIDKKTKKANQLVPFAPYQGLLYLNEQDTYKDYHNNLEATSFLMDFLYSSCGVNEIAFSNSYKVKDIRAIQWHHYHTPDKGVYDIQLRWTSIIKGVHGYSLDMASKGRKLDYRYSINRYGIKLEESCDVRDFVRLYEITFFSQGIDITDETMNKVLAIIDTSLKNGIGRLIYAVDSNGKRIDASFILTEFGRSYYIFGANDPLYKKMGGGTLILMNELLGMREKSISEFDFIGINSPNRGDYKLSFGGTVEPYYACSVRYNR